MVARKRLRAWVASSATRLAWRSSSSWRLSLVMSCTTPFNMTLQAPPGERNDHGSANSPPPLAPDLHLEIQRLHAQA